MNRIWLIAHNTTLETIRKQTFFNILVFGVGMVAFGMVVGNLTIGYPDRVVRSIGLSGISIGANLMALLVGVGLVHREIERKTLFVVLTHPVERWQYVLGRYFGLAFTLFGLMSGFAAAFFLTLVYVGGTPSSVDLLALGLSFIEACVLGGFAIVLSSFSTPSLSAGIGLGFWVASASTEDLVNLTQESSPLGRGVAQTIAFTLPSFSRFDLREAAVYADGVDVGAIAYTVAYGTLYMAGFAALASAILARREMI